MADLHRRGHLRAVRDDLCVVVGAAFSRPVDPEVSFSIAAFGYRAGVRFSWTTTDRPLLRVWMVWAGPSDPPGAGSRRTQPTNDGEVGRQDECRRPKASCDVENLAKCRARVDRHEGHFQSPARQQQRHAVDAVSDRRDDQLIAMEPKRGETIRISRVEFPNIRGCQRNAGARRLNERSGRVLTMHIGKPADERIHDHA